MTHRYPTRYQIKNTPYEENKLSEEQMKTTLLSNHQKEQEALLTSLIPFEMEHTIYSILSDHHDNKIILTNVELKEANQIWDIISTLKSKPFKMKMFSHHYPIIYRLQANIDLFTYIKYNHDLIKRFPRIANIYHDYYAHFSSLYNRFWKNCTDSEYAAYKDVNSQYCTLLSSIKDVIHNGELILINQGLLKYY
jgi:hypothetical protein